MLKKRLITWISIIIVITLLAILICNYIIWRSTCGSDEECSVASYITEDYDWRHYECNSAVLDGDCGLSSCNSDILNGVDCGIMWYFKIHVLKIKPRNYKSWKSSCEYVNNYLNCWGYDCSIEWYYFNHNLCRH